MKLSVIVPAYRLAPFIGPCLNSLATQHTNFDFEIIVCNDASPDDTLGAITACARLHPQIRVLDNKQNLGLVGTMRRLLEAAQGQYIAYLDGDDLALPGKFQAQVDYLDTHPECALVYHESEVFDSDSGATLRLYTQDYYNAAYVPQQASAEHLVRYGTFLQASSGMFRRHAHLVRALEHGCKIICDYPWYIANALLIGGSIDFIPEVYGRYRMHGGSFGAATARDTQRRLTVTRELEQACRFAAELGMPEQAVQMGIAHARFAAALYFLRAGEDQLFHQLIEESSHAPAPFDERHAFAIKHSSNPSAVRAHLGWSAP